MSLQPSNKQLDRETNAPFLLRLFWRQSRPHDAAEFSVAPPEDTSTVTDYTSLLPSNIRQQSVQIYTWPNCTLAELTGLMGTVLPENVTSGGNISVGTRLIFKLIFADTRGDVHMGRGRWLEKPLGSVVVGGREAVLDSDDAAGTTKDHLEGDAERTLADARFVIGDYVACSIYPPMADGRVQPPPTAGGRGAREPYAPPRGLPGGRENGFGGGYRGGRGGFRGGGGGGFGRRLLRVGIGGEGRGRRWVGLDMAAGTGVGGGGRIDRRAPWKNRGGTGLVLKRGVGGQSGEEHSARNFMNDVREKSTRPVQRHH